jgi:uncharacterized membrane protein required for colicin V production
MPEWLSLVDLAFVGVALLFAWGGSQRGFAVQVAHILTFLILGAILFFAYPVLFNYLSDLFRRLHKTYLMWFLLAGVFALTFAIFILITKLMAKMLKTQVTDAGDRAWGGILGLVRGALVALFAMIFLVILGPPFFYDLFTSKAYSGRLVCTELVPRIQPHLTPSVLEARVQQFKDSLMEQEEAGVFDE